MRSARSITLVAALAFGGLSLIAAPPASAWPGDVVRIQGASRYDTAARVALSRFTTAKRVYVATGEAFSDALAASGAAGFDSAPVLLVKPTEVPAETATALETLKPESIVVIGGDGAVSPAVADRLGRVAPVTRIRGADRYATAAALYADRGTVPAVFVVNGDGFADALSVGAKAAKDKLPLLLVRRDGIPTATADALRTLRPSRVVIVGGEAAVSGKVERDIRRSVTSDIHRWAGADRFETAATVARLGAFGSATAYLATGTNFPDALAAGAVAGAADAPVLLTTQACTAAATRTVVDERGYPRVVVLGGENAVSTRAATGDVNCPQPVLPQAPRYASNPDNPIRAAFYYGWYPSGFETPGSHYAPSAGHYDTRDENTVRRQVGEMRHAGIQAAIASWWGPTPANAQDDYAAWVTDDSLQTALRASQGTPFTWTLYYEDEGYGDPSLTMLKADLDYVRSRYVNHPNYLWVDGRPVIFVWPQPGEGCEMTARWRQAAPDFYVVHKRIEDFGNCVSGADAWHQYAPGLRDAAMSPWSYAVSAGYWQYNEASPRLARDPGAYDAAVGRMRSARVPWHLVTTYNEWGEGTAVEPSTEWGTTYLDILHRHYGGF